MSNGLIKTRINENILKVKDESENVKNMLSLANTQSKASAFPRKWIGGVINLPVSHADELEYEMYIRTGKISRNELLHIAMLLATSRNISAQQRLIGFVAERLGVISAQDYHEMAIYIYNQPENIVNKVNKFLSDNLKGYKELHSKNYAYYYVF